MRVILILDILLSVVTEENDLREWPVCVLCVVVFSKTYGFALPIS